MPEVYYIYLFLLEGLPNYLLTFHSTNSMICTQKLLPLVKNVKAFSARITMVSCNFNLVAAARIFED